MDECKCVCHLADEGSPEGPIYLGAAQYESGPRWCCECWTLKPIDEYGQDGSAEALAVFEAITHVLNGQHPAECFMCTYWLGGVWADCPEHGANRVVVGAGETGPAHDPYATDQLDCGCEFVWMSGDVKDRHFVRVWSNARKREADERCRLRRAAEALRGTAFVTDVDGTRRDIADWLMDEPSPLTHPEGHLAGRDYPCNDCGARWQRSAIEDGAWVIVHRPGCTYHEPGIELNEHVVGRDRGSVTIKVLASVLCWIAALMVVVWVPLQAGRIDHARMCRHAAVTDVEGLDYHDGKWWTPTGRIVGFAPTEDSKAFEIEGCQR